MAPNRPRVRLPHPWKLSFGDGRALTRGTKTLSPSQFTCQPFLSSSHCTASNSTGRQSFPPQQADAAGFSRNSCELRQARPPRGGSREPSTEPRWRRSAGTCLTVLIDSRNQRGFFDMRQPLVHHCAVADRVSETTFNLDAPVRPASEAHGSADALFACFAMPQAWAPGENGQ